MSLLLNALKKAEESDSSQVAQAEETSSQVAPEASGSPAVEEGQVAASSSATVSPSASPTSVDFDSITEEEDSGSSGDEEKRKRVNAARVFGAGGSELDNQDVSRLPFKKALVGIFGIVVIGAGGFGILVSGLIPGLDVSSIDQMLGRQSTAVTGSTSSSSESQDLAISEDVVLLPIPAVDVQSEVDFAALRLPENSRDRLGDDNYGERIAILTGYDINRELARQEEEERALRLALDADQLEGVDEDVEESSTEVVEEEVSESSESAVRTADASRVSKAKIDARTPYDQILDVAINNGRSVSGDEGRQGEKVKSKEVAQIEVGLSKDGLDRQRLLNQARQLYYSGSYVEAETVYRNVLLSDQTNLDALRGLAQIAVITRRYQAAIATYLDILNYYPGDPIAIAELTNLRGGGEGFYEIERALKKALGKMPAADARLYFALGNLYAENNRWLDAQVAYFDAFSRESSNPDYAYNLAVVLDYLNKSSLAVQYYREALNLSDGVLVGFDRKEVESRIADFE